MTYILLQQVSLATEEEEAADLVAGVQGPAPQILAGQDGEIVGRVKELRQKGPAPHQGPAWEYLE